MDKRLIYTNDEGVKMEKNYAFQVEMNLNKALDVFHSSQSFAKIETAKEALAFAKNPLEYFDRCMIEATNVKPIGNVPLNPESIATMYGISRQQFISDCVAKSPGGNGQLYPIRMTPRDEALVKFEKGKFVIDETALEARLEIHRTYAQTQLQLDTVAYWENLVEMLNKHIDSGFVNKFELYKTSRSLGLTSQNDRFAVDYRSLAQKIKAAS